MKNESSLSMLSNEERILLRKLEEVSSLAPYCQKPPEGWICSLGKALGLSSSELVQKTLVTEQTLQFLEEEVPLFLQHLNQISTVFEGKFQYVCIPNNIDNLKETILTNDTPLPHDKPSFLERFEHLPPLPQRPSKGWIQFMRLARGMTAQQLAKKLHTHKSKLLKIEKAEILDELFTDSLTKFVKALGCRLEYFFIPEDDFLTNSYAEQPIIQQLISISSLSLRPPHGWIGTRRKILGILPLQLASKLNIGRYELLNIEKDEGRLLKTFNNKHLDKIAQALGCRFEYCFVPIASIHFDQNLMAQFENFPVYNAPTNKGQFFHLRKALGIPRPQLSKKLNLPICKIEHLEKMEAKGNIFYPHVTNMAQALGCQIKYIFLSEEDNLKKMKPQEALFWNDLKKQADLFPRPPEGWFCYLRNSLKMTPSELSVKIGEKEELIVQVEQDEVNDKIIKEPMMEIAQALGFRIDYIISPQIKSKQDHNFEQRISNQESVERFRKLSLLPEKPEEGWIRAIRKALGLKQIEISKDTNLTQTHCSTIEIMEEKKPIISHPLEAILQTLDAHVELVFIPNDVNALRNAFIKKKGSLKKPKIPKAPSKQKPFTFFIAFDQLALDQKKPVEGWIRTLRKIQGLSHSALAKRMGCTSWDILSLENMEIQNRVYYPQLRKVAHALGYHLDYTFIPNNLSFERNNTQQHFPKEFELPLQVFQAPPEGWVSTIRKSFGLKEIELSKKINKIRNCVTVLEKREKNGDIIPQTLKKIAEALDCKIELLFIPERAFFEEFTSSSGHSLSAQKLYKKLEIISSFYERPIGGWIYFMRRIRGKTWKQLAKEAKLSLSHLKYMVRLDANNSLGTDNMRSIAQALGGRFDYFLVPNTSLKAPLSKDLLYQFSPSPQKPPEGWIENVRLARGLSRAELAKMADISVHQLEKVEKYESQNKFIYSNLQKATYALGGRLEYVLIPHKPPLSKGHSLVPVAYSNIHTQNSLNPMKNEESLSMLSGEERILLKKLEEISSLAPYCQKPPEGWICSLGKALGLSSSELAEKVLVTEQTLQLLEQEETDSLKNLNQIAEVFEGKFQYVIIPNNIENLKEAILLNNTPFNDNLSSFKIFERFSSLPQRPSNGWIQFMRLARNITSKRLAKKLSMGESTLLHIERAEALNELFNEDLVNLTKTLGCRLEYFFIPEDDFLERNLSAEQPLIQQLISISSLSLRPPQGWIRAMREILEISLLQLAEKLNIGQAQLLNIEKNENNLIKTFNNKNLSKIAQALGCRLEYCFIPLSPLQFDQNLITKFESFPVYNAPTSKNQLFHLRLALGVTRLQLCKELNLPFYQLCELETLQKKGNIFHSYVINMAQSLGCEIKYIFIPEEEALKKMKPHEALFWKDLKRQADLLHRPPEGWFCYLRNTLKMSSSELSAKIGIKEEFIIQIEQDEVNNKIIKNHIIKIAQALGFRIEYIVCPYIRPKQEHNFEQRISNHESIEKFRTLSFLPERPNEGWIKALRIAFGLTQKELSKHTDFVQTALSGIEKTEKTAQIIPRPLEPILQILDARAELIFIPHDLNVLQNSFMNKNGSLKKPRVSGTSEISPNKIVFDVLKTLEQRDLVQKKPGKGWISIRQKRKALSRDALEKKLKCKNECNWNIEKLEIQNKSPSQHLKKVTYDLGRHFEHISPNNPFFKENRKRELLKEFELPFEIYQTPADGWISTIRKTFGLKKMELNTKINKRYRCGSRLEKLEKKGKFTPPYLKKVAQALDCKVELLFIPEKAFFTEFTLSYQKLFKKFKKASSLPSKPPIGWIRTIRMALGMSVTKFSQRINVSILRVRENEFREIKNDNIVHPLLKKIADTLGYHVDYIFIPEKDAVAGVPIGDSQLLKKLKRYSAISERPPEGWIKAVQMLHGLTQSELARKINYSTSHISRYEEEEARDGLVPKPMKAIAQALGGRFDYRLIPISPLPSQELYKKLEKIFYSYHKPSEGWIFFIRKMRGKRWNQVAKETKLNLPRLQQIASSEAKNILPIPNMQIAAEVFGGRFEYVLIPEESSLPQDRSLVPLLMQRTQENQIIS